MKKSLRIICLLAACAFLLCTAACASSPMYYFNTEVTLALTDGALTSSERNKIENFLSDVEKTFSVTDKNSEIYKINSAPAGKAIEVSEKTSVLLDLCKKYYEFSQGKFNVGILPLTRLWGLSADTFGKVIMTEVPSTDNIANAKAVSFDFENNFKLIENTVIKSEDGNAIDLGGIVKGYSVDGIKKILDYSGRKEGYISIGGSSIYIFSVKEDLLIKHPRKKGDYILSVSNELVNGTAISTSGDYQRYYTIGGERYCHIIDCEKGAPISTGFSSVTVIGDKSDGETNSACFTDMISTALMCMEEDELKEFVNKNLSSLSVFAVYEKGGVKKILTNRMIEKDFTVSDGEYIVEKF